MLERRQRLLQGATAPELLLSQNGVHKVSFCAEIGGDCRSKDSTEKYVFYVMSFKANT